MTVVSVDRAVRSAAPRALHTRRRPRWWRALASGLALMGCAGSGPEAPTILSRSHGSQTLVLLPLNVTAVMPAELEPQAAEVFAALRAYLEQHGATLKTVAYPTARNLWLASIREARTGEKGRRAGFDDAARLFAQRLAQHSRFDAMLVASLFVQRATVAGRWARWDGVQHPLQAESGRWRGVLPEEQQVSGAAPAASLHAVILDAEGGVLHEKQTGLALLARVRLAETPAGETRYSFAPIEDPFADREQLREGIALALAPYLPELRAAP